MTTLPVPAHVSAREVTLIEVQFRRGEGVNSDPVRMVTAWFTKKGDQVAESDPITSPSNTRAGGG